VADLVDMVNEELRDRLGGPHLQIGPSHFMMDDLDIAKLRRIWTYNVFPYIEEQLYGEWDEIEDYRWDNVYSRFKGESGELANEEAGQDGLDDDLTAELDESAQTTD
jgi:5-methylcytosine-specific restriction protein B